VQQHPNAGVRLWVHLQVAAAAVVAVSTHGWARLCRCSSTPMQVRGCRWCCSHSVHGSSSSSSDMLDIRVVGKTVPVHQHPKVTLRCMSHQTAVVV
jgi:hypothetical protein